MSGASPSILFAPASGPGGSGEYYRCLALARAMIDDGPECQIGFLLHRQARVERDARFAYHQLSATPARAGTEVISWLRQHRPSLAVFDCTGRVAQFRAARQLGARVAWISNRPRKRAKGFRPRQMRWMDLHVIIDSVSAEPHLRRHERVLLHCFPNVKVELARAVVPQPDDAALAPWASSLPDTDAFALFVAGGGGYARAGRSVPELFLDAARRFRQASDRPAVLVLGPQYRGAVASDPEVSVIPALPTAALGALLARARVAVIGAGNMLSEQALAAGVPLVVTAAGGRDQPRRVRMLQRSGRARSAALEPAALCDAAVAMLDEAPRRGADQSGSRARDDTARIARRLLSLADRVAQ